MYGGQAKGLHMKTHSFLKTIISLGVAVSALNQGEAGVILISTRKNMCTDDFEIKGPGMTAPGDVAMGATLGDYGYSSRLIQDTLLNDANYYTVTDDNFKIDLVIWSGSSASADVPMPPGGIPLMMGEHVTLGNRTDRPGSIFMYNGTQSSDPNESTGASKYMKIINPNHPIVAGIPTDSQGRVKIFREAYPDEEAHVPETGKRNFEYRWCTQVIADKAEGTTVIGVLDGAEDRSVLAVVDVDGKLANDQSATARMVHMFTNENGSGGSRRVFLALTELGKAIFVRSAKWAMGEELTPFQSFKILEVKREGGQQISLKWESSPKGSYKIQAATNFENWQTVVDDIPGADQAIRSTLDIAAGPQALYLRVHRVL
jgi:hypothetical protein